MSAGKAHEHWHSRIASANHASLKKTANSARLSGPDRHWSIKHEIPSPTRPHRPAPLDSETKTSGGIIIPDTAAEKPQQGEVIAVGPGARGEDGKIVPLELKPKDKVLFGKWSGTEVKIDGQELLIMKESDVMGVLAK